MSTHFGLPPYSTLFDFTISEHSAYSIPTTFYRISDDENSNPLFTLSSVSESPEETFWRHQHLIKVDYKQEPTLSGGLRYYAEATFEDRNSNTKQRFASVFDMPFDYLKSTVMNVEDIIITTLVDNIMKVAEEYKATDQRIT